MRKNMYKLIMTAALTAMFITGCSKATETNGTDSASTNVETTVAPTEVPTEVPTEAPTEAPVVEEVESTATVYPLTIEIYDAEGNTHSQTFDKAPTAVVTNNVSSTDLLLELGLQDRIIGILKPDNKVSEKWASAYESLTVLGDKKTMSKEVIIGAEPELIIGRAMPFSADSMGTITDLNEMDINVYTQYASNFIAEQSLDNIILDVRNIGTIFDVADKANEYADTLEANLSTIRENVAKLNTTETKKVMFMVTYNEGTFNTFGANSTLQREMLKEINAENVLEMGTSALTSENLVALNPDVIVYIKSDRNAETDGTAVEKLLADETIQSVGAIANKQIIEIAYDDLMDYGVRVLDTLQVLYDFMY